MGFLCVRVSSYQYMGLQDAQYQALVKEATRDLLQCATMVAKVCVVFWLFFLLVSMIRLT